jgi:hypothetical protein
MKRLLPLVLLLGIGFYVAWPLWSLHRIAEAIRADDETTLASKIDFPSVRASLRPMLTEEVTKRYEQLQSGSSSLRALLATQMKSDVLPRLVDAALDAVVTPANVLHIARNREALKVAMQRALEDQIILGGFGRRAPKTGTGSSEEQSGGALTPPAAAAGTTRHAGASPSLRYGLSNIKSFAITSPVDFEIGINRNASAPDAELKARLAFTSYDWKVVGLVPSF